MGHPGSVYASTDGMIFDLTAHQCRLPPVNQQLSSLARNYRADLTAIRKGSTGDRFQEVAGGCTTITRSVEWIPPM